MIPWRCLVRIGHTVFFSVFLLVVSILLSGTSVAAKGDSSPVYVILWFDTEDFILPESDDALLRIATFLAEESAPATFKIVGEKARVLKERDRKDILTILKRHDVGYHTNFHSVQPTPALYLSPLGWEEGVAEFQRREYPGLVDLQRITGRPASCYGQPGSSWGPQQYGALRSWRIPVYLDDGSHVSLDGRPFWYDGILTFYSLTHTIRTELGGSNDLEHAKAEFQEAHRELKESGGGVISIYYHPCEFVHAEFWDGVNFSEGANPPRSTWKKPPVKSAEEVETAHTTFEDYIRFIKSFPKIRFKTARMLPALYPDLALLRSFSEAELLEIARAVESRGVNYQEQQRFSLSASEIFSLLTRFAETKLADEPATPLQLERPPILGPINLQPAQRVIGTSLNQYERTVQDVVRFMKSEERIPGTIWLGSQVVSPESFLVTTARYVLDTQPDPGNPAEILFEPAELRPAKHVKNDKSIWDWVIFPPNFEAPEMMELAKRQSWTLKPALPIWQTVGK